MTKCMQQSKTGISIYKRCVFFSFSKDSFKLSVYCNFACFFVVSRFFPKSSFTKISLECPRDWIQIRPIVLGPSADDISVEGKELTKCEPDILFVEGRPDQIPQNALSPPSVRKKFGSRS